MNSKALILILLIFFTGRFNLVNGQSDSSINDELRHMLINLDRSNCPTQFLYDLAAHTSDESYYTPLNTIDTGSMLNWWQIYFEMYYSAYNMGVIPPDTIAFEAVQDLQNGADAVYLGLMDFDYNAIRGDAWDSVNYGRWYLYTDDTIWDRPGRLDRPFIINPVNPSRGECNEIFVFSPLSDEYFFKQVTYKFNPGAGNHWFYDNYYSTNILSHPSPHRFQIDFGDGNGFIDVDPFNSFSIDIEYPDSGTYYLTARVLMEGNVIKSSRSRIEILTNLDKIYPDAVMTDISGLTASLFKSGCNPSDKLKPIIYLSGIDIQENRTPSEIYASMMRDNRILALKNFDYDVIIVDWVDSKDPIEWNAMYLRNLLEKLKEDSDSTHQFIIIGESMGGLVARYAMCYMESDFYKTATMPGGSITAYKPHLMHNTRLLITLDSPHKGANNPLAFQHAADWAATIGKKVVRSTFIISYFVNLWKQYDKRFLGAASVQQMLIYHKSTRDASGNYTQHWRRTDFQNNLNSFGNDGWPRYAKKMLLSNGLLNGAHQIKYQDAGLAGGGENLVFMEKFIVSVRILRLIPIPILIHNNIKMAAIPPSGSGNIFHVPPGFTLLVGIRGCFVKFVRRKSWCGLITTPNINVDVNNLIPIDVMPGGSEVAGENFVDGKYKLPKKGLMPIFYRKVVDSDPWAGTFKMKYKVRVFNSLVLNMAGSSDLPRSCFVPLQSALAYTDTTNSISEDFDISAETIATNMSRTKADIIIGWRHDSACLHSTLEYHDNYTARYTGFACKNTYHIDWRLDHYISSIGVPDKRNYICREIGDDVMWLDNMLINRASLFEAYDLIESGYNVNQFYAYTNASHTGTRREQMQSRGDKFIVDSFGIGQVEFRTGREIRLLNGFECRRGGRFWAYIDTTYMCEVSWSDLNNGRWNYGRPSNENESEIELTENQEELLNLFPNPSSDNFILKTNLQSMDSYKIIDVNGRILVNQTIENPDKSITVCPNLPKGVYWIQVHLQNDLIISKVFIID